jgi:hypothetical protein
MLGNAAANRSGSRVLEAHLSEEGRPMPKRSIVRLDARDRARLHQLLVGGTAAARTLLTFLVLLYSVFLGAIVVSGLAASGQTAFPLKGDRCTVYALDPERPRLVVCHHPGRGLAGALTVRGDEKDAPVIRLRPTGAVTGRVLDLEGRPVAGAAVTFDAASTDAPARAALARAVRSSAAELTRRIRGRAPDRRG